MKIQSVLTVLITIVTVVHSTRAECYKSNSMDQYFHLGTQANTGTHAYSVQIRN